MKVLILAMTPTGAAYAHAREEDTGEETTHTPIEVEVETSHDGSEERGDERWAPGRHTVDMGKLPEAESPSRDCLATKSGRFETTQKRSRTGNAGPR